MSRQYKDLMSEDDIAAYRKKTESRKQKEADAAAETDAEAAKARREQARQELEDRVKTRFLDSGGTAGEWARMKTRLVEAALIAAATQPVEESPEPEKPQAESPLSRRQYLDR